MKSKNQQLVDEINDEKKIFMEKTGKSKPTY
jgi:hypothetical protein